MADIIDKSVADYQILQERLPGCELPWLKSLRQSAVRQFSERGFPTPRDEAWKYTNLAPVMKKGFTPLAEADDSAAAGIDLESWLLPDLDPIRLVFVDGHFTPALSNAAALPDGAVIASLAERLHEAPADVEAGLAAPVPAGPQGFAELNTAFMTDGAFLRIPAGVAVGQPIHLLYVVRESAQPGAVFLRNVMVAEKGSSATVIQHYVSVDGARSMVNSMTQCSLAQDAALDHYLVNEQGDGVYHFGGVQVHQDRGSRYASHNLQTGARLARSDLYADLAGEGCECTMNGFYFGRGRQHIDSHTRIDHQVPHCMSRELYKGVLDDRSRGIFNGKIIVREGAQRTDSQQMSRSLLLSDEAEADTRPQLEIYADDVKCSHGATIGQLDRDALFYLQARGIDDATARRMLIAAFAGEIAERMALAPLRGRIEQLVAGRLAS